MKVYKIFAEVYKNYDTVNTVCSLGTIVQWRRTGAKAAMADKGRLKILDIATGTGEYAIELYKEALKKNKKAEITGMDFSENMLSVAMQKAKERGLAIKFEHGDAMRLKYPGSSFDVVTSSFALRNVDDLDKFCSESKRVLKKGGKFVFMDMARPDNALQRAFLKSFWTVVGGIGFAENKKAYYWLMESVDRFDKEGFVKRLRKAGFKDIKKKNLFTGSAFMVTGRK